jgi:hypothetical protein
MRGASLASLSAPRSSSIPLGLSAFQRICVGSAAPTGSKPPPPLGFAESFFVLHAKHAGSSLRSSEHAED